MRGRRVTLGVGVGVLLVLLGAIFGVVASAARSSSGPSCDRPQARLAAYRSPLGDQMQRAAGSPLDSSVWGFFFFSCTHLRSSHETDMVAEFGCCTANSPTPIGIFRPGSNGRWHLTYSWAGEPPVYGLRLSGRTLVGKTPVYNGGPLCCPAGYRPWSIRWNGHRWIVIASYNERP